MSIRETKICSIYGQIEGVVADAMAEQGLVHRIKPEDIPPTARYDEEGRMAHCAIVLTPEMEREFDERVRRLRA
jgi:hypothetical protein